MDRVNITASEILDALQKSKATASRPKGCLTMVEVQDALGIGASTARERVKTLWRKGMVEVVMVWTATMDGRQRLVPAYRMRKGKK